MVRLGRKKYGITFIVLALLVGLRVLAPIVAERYANDYLKKFSPIIAGHIDDIDLAIWRGALGAEGVKVTLKKNNQEVLSLKEVEFSLAWKEVFKGKILGQVLVDGAVVHYSKNILAELKKLPKKEAKEKALTVDVESLELKNSKVLFEDLKGLSKGKKLTISGIDATVTNLTPKKEYPYSFFNMKAVLQDDAPLKIAGKINRLDKPLGWDIDATLQSFDLTSVNSILKKKLPLTFTKGTLDLYAEAKSEEGKTEGYLKPFLKELDVIKNPEDFKGPKHWLIEAGTAIGNILLKNENLDSLATRIPFKFGKDVEVDTGEAIEKAIQHGYQKQLSPGIENKFEIQ